VVPQAGGGYSLSIFYATQAELTGQGTGVCFQPPSGKTVNGTVAGVGPTDLTQVFVGGSLGTLTGTNYQVQNVPNGTVDLFAGHATLTISGTGASIAVDKLIIRRDLNPANGATLPVLDFGGTEAFAPQKNTLTVNGLGAGESAIISESYYTPNGFVGSVTGDPTETGATHTLYGVPAAKQAAGDLHGLNVIASNVTGGQAASVRYMTTYFHTASDRTVTLGPSLNAPTITTVATTPYVRFRAQLAQQPEYDKAFAVTFGQGTGAGLRATTISATPAYLNGAAFDFTIPDFSGVAGFDPNWGLKAGVATTWSVTAIGWNGANGIFNPVPAEGAVVQFASRTGTVTP
jgi:hypothetical protein